MWTSQYGLNNVESQASMRHNCSHFKVLNTHTSLRSIFIILLLFKFSAFDPSTTRTIFRLVL